MSDELKAIQERCEKATPGPWEYRRSAMDLPEVITRNEKGFVNYIIVKLPVSRVHDTLFIAHARQDIPFLLSEIARLTAERDALKAENERLKTDVEELNDEASKLIKRNAKLRMVLKSYAYEGIDDGGEYARNTLEGDK